VISTGIIYVVLAVKPAYRRAEPLFCLRIRQEAFLSPHCTLRSSQAFCFFHISTSCPDVPRGGFSHSPYGRFLIFTTQFRRGNVPFGAAFFAAGGSPLFEQYSVVSKPPFSLRRDRRLFDSMFSGEPSFFKEDGVVGAWTSVHRLFQLGSPAMGSAASSVTIFLPSCEGDKLD